MNKLSTYIVLFSIFLSLAFSEPSLPLRGTSKDIQTESSSVDNKNSIGVIRNENEESINQDSTHSDISNKSVKDNISETRVLSESRAKLSTPEKAQDTEESGDKCGNSFVMWFSNGIVVTTVECTDYTIIYTSKREGDLEPRYIQGKVTSVTVESENVKVNNVALSGISTNPDSPTANGGGSYSSSPAKAKARVLETEATQEETVKVYSFPLKDMIFDVYLPNQSEANKRNKYSLSYNDKVFYSGSENESKYTLKENGDLVNSKDQVVLEKDSTSSAFKTMYVIPSLFATLISIFVL